MPVAFQRKLKSPKIFQVIIDQQHGRHGTSISSFTIQLRNARSMTLS
jgi:hypothetical protein